MVEWIQTHETVLWSLVATSVIMLIATLIIVPLLVVRIPSYYFAHRKRRRSPWVDQHPVVRWVLLTAKNMLGYVFVVVGVAMLVLPGQGILTILAGIMLLNFPGKYKLERWVVTRRPVLRSINWLRRRAERAPLVLESHPRQVRRSHRQSKPKRADSRTPKTRRMPDSDQA